MGKGLMRLEVIYLNGKNSQLQNPQWLNAVRDRGGGAYLGRIKN